MDNIYDNIDNIFWEKTPHAKDFIDDVVERLDDNKNIILVSSNEIPWYSSLGIIIEEIMKDKTLGRYEGITIEEYPEQFLFEEENSIKKNLLANRNFFDEQTSCSTKARKSKFVKFFAEEVFMHNYENDKDFYVWLELYSEKSFKNWVNFISAYIEEENKNSKNIVFVISYHNNFNLKEVKSEEFNNKIQSNFDSVSLNLNWYDCYVFFTTIISNSKYIIVDDYFKLYLAELFTNIVRKNISEKIIRLCVDCLKDYNNFLKNSPYKKIQSIFLECNIGKDAKDIAREVKETIYRSQIRVFYPLLNEFRLYFTKKYMEELNDIIKNNKKWLNDICREKHTETPKEAKDFELGLLQQCGWGRPPKIKYSSDDKEDLDRFAAARNLLSHIDYIYYSGLNINDPKSVDLKYIVEIFKSKVLNFV